MRHDAARREFRGLLWPARQRNGLAMRFLICRLNGAAGTEILRTALGATGMALGLDEIDGVAAARQEMAERLHDGLFLWPPLAHEDVCDLLAELGGPTPGLPVICFATQTASDGLRRVLAAGAADCLSAEDLSPSTLLRAVHGARRLAEIMRQLERAEQHLAEQTVYDPLTRLPDRSQFLIALQDSLDSAPQRPIALLLLDLIGFNKVNQSLGHEAGDKLLELTSGRLREVLQAGDRLARVGDDEFGVMLPPDTSLAHAVTVASRIVERMQAPFKIGRSEFMVGVGIGIAHAPLHGREPHALMRNAETAMRAAKRQSTGFAVFEGDPDGDENDELALSHDLRRAVDDDALELNFQPKIDMARRRIEGVECLLRWRHPKLGLIFPDLFIPLAEQTGMIGALTSWVLDTALRYCAQWQDQGWDLTVSVNISALTLHNPGFPRSVAAGLARWNVAPDRLVLEITETAIISDAARATETLNRLDGMGVAISIDDFGTGYTSLGYLRRLPISELKIDKSFVMNMQRVPDDEVIVRTMIELAHNLSLKVTAEGVEDEPTLDRLGDLACDTIQGYYVSRPLDEAAFAAWLVASPWAGGLPAGGGGAVMPADTALLQAGPPGLHNR